MHHVIYCFKYRLKNILPELRQRSKYFASAIVLPDKEITGKTPEVLR
jgi:hypothetical protein